jgi:pimeloyl-ACP methyl ester carboxylesterase
VDLRVAKRRHAAYDRISGRSGVPHSLAHVLAALPVEVGFVYARLRYGIDFAQASPKDAVAHSTTPALLIHGLDDRNLLPENSVRIQHARATNLDAWFIPGAAHFAVHGQPSATPLTIASSASSTAMSHSERLRAPRARVEESSFSLRSFAPFAVKRPCFTTSLFIRFPQKLCI